MGDALLSGARFVGFKSLEDARLRFSERLMLIVGRNASGKSSILDGLDLAANLVPEDPEDRWQDRLRQDLAALDRLAMRGAARTVVGLGLRRASFWIDRSKDGAVFLGVGGLDQLEPPVVGVPRLAKVSTRESPGKLRELFSRDELRGFPRVVRLRLAAAAIAAPALMTGKRPELAPDGAGLPAVLAWLAINDRAARDRIEADLARIVPGAGEIRTPNEEIATTRIEEVRVGAGQSIVRMPEAKWGYGLEVKMHDAGFLPADLLSEGTLLTLALLTAVHAPGGARVLLLDDIEQGLHPAAQVELLASLRELLQANRELQIIATTHSPYLVDELEGDEVIVLRADARGHTHARLLREHPEWNDWSGTLETGEFWSSVGDDWVLDPPAHADEPAAE